MVEKAVFASLGIGDKQSRSHAAGSPHQAGRQPRIALGVGRRLAEHLVVDGDQADMDIADRTGDAQ